MVREELRNNPPSFSATDAEHDVSYKQRLPREDPNAPDRYAATERVQYPPLYRAPVRPADCPSNQSPPVQEIQGMSLGECMDMLRGAEDEDMTVGQGDSAGGVGLGVPGRAPESNLILVLCQSLPFLLILVFCVSRPVSDI